MCLIHLRLGSGDSTGLLAWFEGTHRLRKIAALLRIRSTGHVSNLVRRAEREISARTELQDRLTRVCALLV